MKKEIVCAFSVDRFRIFAILKPGRKYLFGGYTYKPISGISADLDLFYFPLSHVIFCFNVFLSKLVFIWFKFSYACLHVLPLTPTYPFSIFTPSPDFSLFILDRFWLRLCRTSFSFLFSPCTPPPYSCLLYPFWNVHV